MDEKKYSAPVLYNEIQNLKQRVTVLEEDSKQDRKEFTQVTKSIAENLVRLTTIQEQQSKSIDEQSKQIDVVNQNIDMLRNEMVRSQEGNIIWYRDKVDLAIKILIALVLIGWGIKGFSEALKLLNL